MIRSLIALAIFASGCSILYNPDNIPSKQDASFIDANPSNLMLADVGPKELLEGQGDGGSRTAVLVIHGDNFVAGAQVELMAATAVHVDVDNTKVQVSADTHYLAVPVTAHVDDAIPDGMIIPLTVKVTQPVPGGGTVSKTLDGQLSLHGLDTLTGGVGDCATVKSLYAKISTTGTFALSSSMNQPCVFRAVSSIAMGDLTARGADVGTASTGAAAGPGGCTGGDGLMPGHCDSHGGRGASGGTLAGGGGGGGAFAMDGGNGTGTGIGGGGTATGDAMVASYATNFASGGGGGAGLINTAGGGGGGGGGTVEITGGGDVTVGMIDVSGGAGGKTNGLNDAGGGGGAGGAIVVRSGGTIVTGKLQAAGGAGGNVSGAVGGAGSPGRIRWEALTGSPAGASSPTPTQGVSFAADTPFAVSSATTALTLVGTPTTMFSIYSKDAAGHEMSGATVSIASSGMAMTNPPLAPGYNRVCITLAMGTHGAAEAERCVDIAYLP